MDAVFGGADADFPHFREGHGLIGFVIQVQSRAIVGLVRTKPSNVTVAPSSGARTWRASAAMSIGPRTNEKCHLEGVSPCGCVSRRSRAQKRDFVAGAQRRIPCSEFLVAPKQLPMSDTLPAPDWAPQRKEQKAARSLLRRRTRWNSSAWPTSSLRRPKNKTFTRIACETGGTPRIVTRCP